MFPHKITPRFKKYKQIWNINHFQVHDIIQVFAIRKVQHKFCQALVETWVAAQYSVYGFSYYISLDRTTKKTKLWTRGYGFPLKSSVNLEVERGFHVSVNMDLSRRNGYAAAIFWIGSQQCFPCSVVGSLQNSAWEIYPFIILF